MNIQILNELENLLAFMLNQTRTTSHQVRLDAYFESIKSNQPPQPQPQPFVHYPFGAQHGNPYYQQQYRHQPTMDGDGITNATLEQAKKVVSLLSTLFKVSTTPTMDVELEIRKIQERLDKLEMAPQSFHEFTWDELQAANRQHETAGYTKAPAGNNPWEYVYHKFTNMLNCQAGSILKLITEKSQVVPSVKTELKSMLSFIATEGRQQTSTASLTPFVYNEALTTPGLYQYVDDQTVVITPVHNGKVYIIIFNPTSDVIYDMYRVDGIDRSGRRNVVPIYDIDVLYEIYDAPTPAAKPAPKTDVVVEEVQERVMYPNVLDIQGMRERIVEMRKGITKITLPKIALRPTITAIGGFNWDWDDNDPLIISADEYQLLAETTAVYSVPDSRIRVVVVIKDGRTVLMSYTSDTYVIHDIYQVTYDEFHNEYSVTQSENPSYDLLFVLSLGEKG